MSFLPLSDATITDVLKRKEGQLFDRKSIQIAPKEFARHLIAFGNADGGDIAVGITNTGEIEGLSKKERAVNALLQASINFCTPPVHAIGRAVPCINRGGEDDFILLVTIESSARVHTTTNGETYFRVGDESRHLSYEQRRQLMYDKGDQQYEDELVAEIENETFDAQLLARFRERLDIEGDTERLLGARYLARKEKSAPTKVTRAGILLFHTDPTQYFPTYGIRLIRYEGTTVATGTRQILSVNERYEKPLPSLVEEVFRDVGGILRQFTRLNPATSTFERQPEYPAFAWREAIVNAVTHRAYNISGQQIEIRLFDNRMEIESPGRLPGMVRVENMRDVHFLRNPRIARVMNDFGFVQDLGEGIDRMYQEMELFGLPQPLFREREGSLLVTLENAIASRDSVMNVAEVINSLPREQRQLLLAMIQRGKLGPKAAETVIGRSRPTVLRHLNNLIRLGLVLRQAATDNDPNAIYIIAIPLSREDLAVAVP